MKALSTTDSTSQYVCQYRNVTCVVFAQARPLMSIRASKGSMKVETTLQGFFWVYPSNPISLCSQGGLLAWLSWPCVSLNVSNGVPESSNECGTSSSEEFTRCWSFDLRVLKQEVSRLSPVSLIALRPFELELSKSNMHGLKERPNTADWWPRAAPLVDR